MTTTSMTTTITGIDRRQWILQHCKVEDNIVDIGSADAWIWKSTPFYDKVTCVDIDKYDLPNFHQMDAQDLSCFKDKEFDTAIIAEILEHVDDSVKVLKEADRISKRILITVPNECEWSPENYPFESLDQNLRRRNLTLEEVIKVSNPNAKEIYDKDGFRHLWHNRHFTESTLKKDLESAGIKDYKLEKLTYGNPQWSFWVVDARQVAPEIPKDIPKGPIITYDVQTSQTLSTSPQPNLKKLKIALISTPFFHVPPDKYGGLEQVVWDLAAGLDELGHKVTIFGPEGSWIPPKGELVITGPSINTVGVDWFEEEKKKYNLYKDLITPEKFDIVHDHTWFAFAYLSKINNPKLRVCHTHHGGIGQWDTPPPFPKPNLIAISKFMQQYTIQNFKQKGFDVGCEYCYNGIDLSKYSFQATKTEHLLFVGRLSTFKQPHVAISVARKANHKLDIVGASKFVDSQSYVEGLEENIKDDPDITLYEDASQELKIEKMQNAKAILIPSKMAEPFGLIAIEAMSCGTPVICLDDGALKEIVLDGITGFVCHDENEMISKINRIYEIKPENCRDRAKCFSREIMAKDYLKLYEKMIKGEDW